MSPLPDAYEKLRARGKDLALLGATTGLLSWDQETLLPPDRFPQVAHLLFNYELFDGPLPKANSSTLAPSQIEFAQKLISRGLLPANALQAAQ